MVNSFDSELESLPMPDSVHGKTCGDELSGCNQGNNIETEETDAFEDASDIECDDGIVFEDASAITQKVVSTLLHRKCLPEPALLCDGWTKAKDKNYVRLIDIRDGREISELSFEPGSTRIHVTPEDEKVCSENRDNILGMGLHMCEIDLVSYTKNEIPEDKSLQEDENNFDFHCNRKEQDQKVDNTDQADNAEPPDEFFSHLPDEGLQTVPNEDTGKFL